jgi:hypothetical protein
MRRARSRNSSWKRRLVSRTYVLYAVGRELRTVAAQCPGFGGDGGTRERDTVEATFGAVCSCDLSSAVPTCSQTMHWSPPSQPALSLRTAAPAPNHKVKSRRRGWEHAPPRCNSNSAHLSTLGEFAFVGISPLDHMLATCGGLRIACSWGRAGRCLVSGGSPGGCNSLVVFVTMPCRSNGGRLNICVSGFSSFFSLPIKR